MSSSFITIFTPFHKVGEVNQLAQRHTALKRQSKMKPRKVRFQSLLLTPRKHCLSFPPILIPSQSSQLTLLPPSGQGITHTHECRVLAQSAQGRELAKFSSSVNALFKQGSVTCLHAVSHAGLSVTVPLIHLQQISIFQNSSHPCLLLPNPPAFHAPIKWS